MLNKHGKIEANAPGSDRHLQRGSECVIHAVYISHPKEVAALIEDAAEHATP